MSSNVIRFHCENDQGEDVEIEIPAKYEVCDRCEGEGSHLTPSIGEHAYSEEEFREAFDEEEREQYFTRGGMYDVVCIDCKGLRVVLVVDEDACKRDGKLTELTQYNEHKDQEASYVREREAERRMGA